MPAGSDEGGRSASRERSDSADGTRTDVGVRDAVVAVQRLGDEAPRGHVARAAEQVTRDAMIAGMHVRGGRAGTHVMLRLVVDEDRRIAVAIVAAGVKRRRERQPGREDDEGL